MVLAPDAPEVDDVLFTALAKGADRALRYRRRGRNGGHAAARSWRGDARRRLLPADLMLTGQAIDDLDGLVAPLLATASACPTWAWSAASPRTRPEKAW